MVSNKSAWTAVLGIEAYVAAISGITALILKMTGAITSVPFALFLVVISVGLTHTFREAFCTIWRDKPQNSGLLHQARVATVIMLAATVPVVFDPHTGDIFSIPKYTLVIVGSLLLALLAGIQAIRDGRIPIRTSIIFWLALISVGWTLVTALSGIDIRLSLLGEYGSYGGFYTSLALFMIFFSTSHDTSVSDIRKIIVSVCLVAGAIVGYYGLLQLHDFTMHGKTWDFVHWAGLPIRNTFSTLGNPNNLAGFIAIILPGCLFLIYRPARLWIRIAAIVTAFFLVCELIQTGSRGGWVATIISISILVVFTAPDLRNHARSIGIGAIAVILIAIGSIALGGSRLLGEKFHRLFQSGGGSSVSQRFALWKASIQIAQAHPLVGTGPDTFRLIFPRYESTAWAHLVGSRLIANGPHNIFFEALSEQGIPGLIFLIGICVAIAAMAIRILLRTHSKESTEEHWIAAVAISSIVAFLVQGLFNTQEIALTFCFWLFVGVLVASSRIISTVNTGVTKIQTTTSPKQLKSKSSTLRHLVTLGGSVVIVIIGALLSVGTIAQYRADHAYWAFQSSESQLAMTPNMDRTQVGLTEAGQGIVLAESFKKYIVRPISY